MPTEAQLIEALKKADAAGDTEAANRFAQIIKEQRGASAPKKQQPAKPTAAPIKAGDVARSGLQGLTLGFSDEMGAGIAAAAAKAAQAVGAVPGDETYAQIYRGMKKQVEADQQQFAQQHPVIAGGSELAGGLALGGPALKAAAGVAPTMMQLAKHGAKTGAMFGGAYGAGKAETGETLGESAASTAKGAAKGAALGGVAGGILTPAIGLAGRTTQSLGGVVKNAIGKQSDKVAKDFAEAMTDDEAAAIVGEIAQKSGMSADDIVAKMQQLGKKSTLADVDENFAGLLHDSLSRFSPAKGGVRKQFADRLLGEHDDVIQSLYQQSGATADDIYNALSKSEATRQKLASPLYKKAFSQDIAEGVLDNPKLKRNEVIQRALTAGEKYAKSDPDRLTELAAEKGAEFVQKPLMPMERWHYAKKALWDKEQAFRRTGNNEMANNIAKNRKLVDGVLNSSPEYAEARKIWSSSLEADAAGEIGQDIMKMPAREFKQAIGDMNAAELERVKMGVMNTLTTKIESTADKRSVARGIVERVDMREKLKSVFGGEKEVEALMKNADKWDAFRQTYQKIAGGSPTKERLQEGAEIGRLVEAVKGPMKQKMLDMLTGERLDSQRAASVAKILSKEGLSKAEVERLININRKMFTPGQGTQAITKATTMPIVSATTERKQIAR
jgi:hypothetical protein